MRKLLFILSLCCFTFVASCSDDAIDVDDVNKQTILIYMPWSGTTSSSGLYSYFLQNLDSIKSAIIDDGGTVGRVLVFLSTSASESKLYELSYENNVLTEIPVKTYSGSNYTTASGITEILNDVQSYAYALNYAMIVGCHGVGWTFKDDWTNYPYQSKQHQSPANWQGAKAQGGFYPTTRFFGSVSDMTYATDIPTLAEGIEGAGIKMQYILFDDCYMSNIETAYELRNATYFLIGSTSEVMAIGMPYQTMWSYLASATPDYSSAVSAFYSFYSSYTYPYGSLTAVDCQQVEKLAQIMKEINVRYTIADSLVDSVQVLDGFNTPIFYDLEDYVENLCENTSLLSDFQSQLDKVVRATETTDSIYSYLYASPKYIKVETSSGVTISDLSRNSVAINGREKTAWWTATH
ncbi:MAG: clostripain-related cysteine peptidase [Prevotella sp.]|jgi:hypothetical protein